MFCYFFIFLMAFFNACMDAFENENFFESIFRHWDQRFWYKRESWKYAKKVGGYKLDGWHISKTLMILCLAAVMVSVYLEPPPHRWYIMVGFIGLIWNITFHFFYHKVFGIK